MPAAHAASDFTSSRGAAAASASVHFTIRIPRVRQVEVLDTPREIEITAEDVARGEKAVPGRMAVKSNARDGSLLQVNVVGPAFSDVEIQGLEQDVRTAGGNAAVAWPSMIGKPWPEARPVVYRVKLAPDAPTGRHAWPVRFTLD